jgi:hypothetical protein
MADRAVSLRRAFIKFSSICTPTIAEPAEFNDAQQNAVFCEETPHLPVLL